MKKFTLEEIKRAKEATIVYPTMGTLSMTIKKVNSKLKIVEGLVWAEDNNSYNMPDDYHGKYEYMNFPFSCIKDLAN